MRFGHSRTNARLKPTDIDLTHTLDDSLAVFVHFTQKISRRMEGNRLLTRKALFSQTSAIFWK